MQHAKLDTYDKLDVVKDEAKFPTQRSLATGEVKGNV